MNAPRTGPEPSSGVIVAPLAILGLGIIVVFLTAPVPADPLLAALAEAIRLPPWSDGPSNLHVGRGFGRLADTLLTMMPIVFLAVALATAAMLAARGRVGDMLPWRVDDRGLRLGLIGGAAMFLAVLGWAHHAESADPAGTAEVAAILRGGRPWTATQDARGRIELRVVVDGPPATTVAGRVVPAGATEIIAVVDRTTADRIGAILTAETTVHRLPPAVTDGIAAITSRPGAQP